jgi:hypothetical protein
MILRLAAVAALALGSVGCGLLGTSTLDLNVGDCFNSGAGEGEVASVEKKNCSELHDYEIYAAFNHPGASDDAFPGSDPMADFAEQGCVDRFEPWVGKSYEESDLYIYHLSPSSDTWGQGDREVLCAVYLQNEQMQGSMEGSAR